MAGVLNALGIRKAEKILIEGVESSSDSSGMADGHEPSPNETSSESLSFRSIALIKSKNEDKRLITCVAMAADEVDAHQEAFTAECVEEASYDFLAKYNAATEVGTNHDGEDRDIDLVASWYTESPGNFDGVQAPANSWLVKFRVNDDAIWSDVKSGKLTGVSIEGLGVAQ